MSASRGIAIGPVFRFVQEESAPIPRYAISEEEAETHWNRLQKAIGKSTHEISLLKDDRSTEQSDILSAQLMMLEDPEFIPQVKRDLFARLQNIETVLADKVGEAAGILRMTGDTYLAERAVDIEDAFERVMKHLLQDAIGRESLPPGSRNPSPANRFIPPGTILVARNLKPSESLFLRDSGVAGIVLEEGGATSHVAILARSWKIPAVMGVRNALDAVVDGIELILDGSEGLIIVNPGNDVINAYRSRSMSDQRQETVSEAERIELIRSPAVTTDGVQVSLRANIALPEEAEAAREEGAAGVGLFRSEFLFLGSDEFPDEETQYEAYLSVAEHMNGAPVIIRTLDAGADKMIGEQLSLKEKNPLLGWRAVRYCLDRRDVFLVQLRAILRASHYGDIRIMFPMISNVEELDAVLDVLEEAKASLARDSLPWKKRLKVGVMIEIPSAAVCADLLAKKVDFMSIGTNDLIQYTMATDRENPKVAHLYDGFNPAVLRLIRQTILAGIKTRTEVSMCGEMAGDPASVFLLMGLGLRNFSMSPALLTPVKELVRRVSMNDAAELAEAAMELSAAREIRKLVQERMKNYE